LINFANDGMLPLAFPKSLDSLADLKLHLSQQQQSVDEKDCQDFSPESDPTERTFWDIDNAVEISYELVLDWSWSNCH
jgi:hypothetical protein